MRHLRRLWPALVVTALAAVSEPAQAQGPTPAQGPTEAQAAAPSEAPYTLRAAVADALARNPSLSVTSSDRAVAGYLRESAEWSRFPTVSAEVAPGVSGSGGNGGNTRLIRVDQPLWAGGRIDGQIDGARAQERGAELAEAESRRALVEQTVVAYLTWAGSQTRLQIAIDGRAIFERLLAYVDRRQVAGAATLSDVTVARARLSAALAQTELLRGEVERARADLQALVVGTTGQPVSPELPALDWGTAEELEQNYLQRSNVVAQRLTDVDAARAAAAVRRGQLLPTLSLRVENQQSNGNGTATSNQTRASLVLNFTSAPGLSGLSDAKAAEGRLVTSQEQVRVAEVDTRLRARAQLADQQSALRQLADLEPQIKDLQLTADSYLRQFEAGRKSWLEVLNIYREVLDTRLSLSRTQTQRDQGTSHLMANTGALLSWIETTPQ